MNNKTIDIVIPWVNGEDKKWQEKASKFMPNEDFNSERFRDWGTLKYLFRSIDCYLPWIHKIYLVTDNQIPDWLNLENKKVQVIDHSEFIPDEFLPSFNSNAILMNAYRIPGLSEQFLIVEDDMLFTRPAKPNDFFRDGKVCDFLIESAISPHEEFSFILMNTLILINNKFNKRKFLKNSSTKYFNIKYGIQLIRSLGSFFYKYFIGFYTRHCIQPYLKSEYKYVVEKVFPKECKNTMMHHIRNNKEDITEWIVRYFNLLNGNFIPISPNRYEFMEISDHEKIKKAINSKKRISICMNDTQVKEEYPKVMKTNIEILESKFNKKSQFEK